MKRLILIAALIAVAGSCFAHGSSHPKQSYDNAPSPSMKPCMIKVSSRGDYVNANTLSFVAVEEKQYNATPDDFTPSWRSKPAVAYYFGIAKISVFADNPQAEIQRFVHEMERKCK